LIDCYSHAAENITIAAVQFCRPIKIILFFKEHFMAMRSHLEYIEQIGSHF
jgi:hypothetical protein